MTPGLRVRPARAGRDGSAAVIASETAFETFLRLTLRLHAGQDGRVVESATRGRPQLYEGWHEWALLTLGRDAALATLAATAAADSAAEGAGFNVAAQAAREAWAAGWRARQGDSPAMPQTLVLAMMIAVGGAAVSLAGTIWLITIYGDLVLILASEFVVFNFVLVVVNAILFVFLRRRSKAAWAWAVALVSLGALCDIMGQIAAATTTSDTWSSLNDFFYSVPLVGDFSMVDIGAGFLTLYLGLTAPLWSMLTTNWLVLHLVGIQVPILVLLLAKPSRRWCRIGSLKASGLKL
jgi:hypothetical protein